MVDRPTASGARPRLAFLLSPRSSSQCQIDKRFFERPRFLEVLGACDDVVRDQLGWSFQDGLDFDGVTYHRAITEAEFEPIVTALQIAMVAVWRDLGARPDAVAGVSGGEYAAAFVAGALSLEDAMSVACCTGHAFTRGIGVGGTIVVNMTREAADTYLISAPKPVFLAAHYSHGNVAFSGDAGAIAAVGADLSSRNVRWRPVQTGMAVHSPLMDGLEEIFMQRLRHLNPRTPSLPIYSAAAGGLLQNTLLDARHWWFVFRQPAYLAGAARRLLQDGFETFVDFGLQPVVSGAIREEARIAGEQVQVFVSGATPGGPTVDDAVQALAACRAATSTTGRAGSDANQIEFDPASPDVRRDPYPHYHELRTRAPVHHLPRAGYWMVLRHEHVTAVLKDPTLFSSAILKGFDSTLIGADPPAHTRVRRLVTEAFTPAKMAALEAHIRARTQQLLDGITGTDAFDLIAEVAMPLPVSVIAELLGMAIDDLDRLKRWSGAVVAAAGGPSDPAQMTRIVATNAELMQFMAGHLERLVAEPGHSLLGDLVAGRVDSHPLSLVEAMSVARLLLVAGNETTTNLIGNAVIALLRHPAELAALHRDPSLVPAAIEETLRYDAPVQAVDRITTAPVEIAGTRIPGQGRVVVMIGAANRDPSAFADPDTFRIARDPRGHLAFGSGPHYCLGSFLSRLEARMVVEGLLSRLPRLKAAQSLDDVEMTPSLHLRGPRRLMLEGPG